MAAGNTETREANSQPKTWKDRIITIQMFTFLSYFVINKISMNDNVLAGSVKSIERRFHIDSATMGVVLMAEGIGPLGGILVISYLANRFNSSYIIGVVSLLCSITMMAFTIPEYIIRLDDGYAESAAKNQTLFCNKMGDNNISSIMDETENVEAKSAAFGIMFGSMLIHGMSSFPTVTLTMAYIEANTEKSKTAIYIAIANLAFGTGPLLGLLLSSWCSSYYVNLSQTSLTPDDPAWIGAWWVAVLVVAGLLFIPSLLFFCFPRSMNVSTTQDVSHEAASQQSQVSVVQEMELQVVKKSDINPKTEKSSFKDKLAPTRIISGPEEFSFESEKNMLFGKFTTGFLFSMKRLVTNPVYVLSVFGYVFWGQFLAGFQGFFPKFYQEMYSMTASKAGLDAALVTGIGSIIGQIATGVIASYIKLSLKKTLMLIIVLTGMSSLLMLGAVFMGCDNGNLVGAPEGGGAFIIDQPCATGCDCSHMPYTPLCDAGLTYFSPCHAGCIETNITTTVSYLGSGEYGDCSCTETSAGTSGACDTECNMFIPYNAVIFLVYLLVSLTVPFIMIFIMRSVESEDRTLGFGLSMFLFGLIGILPAPALYGSVIDSSCLVWEDQGDGVMGSCWVYDIVALRQRVHGLCAGQRFLKFLCFAIAFILARNKFESWEVRNSDEEDQAEHRAQSSLSR